MTTFDEPALFDVTPLVVIRERPPAKTRREERQGQRLQRGVHPLQPIVGRMLKLHPEAAPADDPHAPGRRCGNCRHRVGYGWDDEAGHYPKCWFGWEEGSGQPPPRYTRSAASDVRAWWPACVDHEWRLGCTPTTGNVIDSLATTGRDCMDHGSMTT